MLAIADSDQQRVFPTQQAFSGPRPGGTHTLNQHTTNALAEFVQSHRYFPRNARRKRSRRQSDACPQLPNQPRPTIKVDKARRQKQHRSLQKEQRAMTAKFKSLNLSDEEDFPILQGQTVAEHSQAPRLGVTVLKDWTKYAAYNFSRRDSEDSIMTEE